MEIKWSHSCTPEKIKYCLDNNIILLEFDLKKDQNFKIYMDSTKSKEYIDNFISQIKFKDICENFKRNLCNDCKNFQNAKFFNKKSLRLPINIGEYNAMYYKPHDIFNLSLKEECICIECKNPLIIIQNPFFHFIHKSSINNNCSLEIDYKQNFLSRLLYDIENNITSTIHTNNSTSNIIEKIIVINKNKKFICTILDNFNYIIENKNYCSCLECSEIFCTNGITSEYLSINKRYKRFCDIRGEKEYEKIKFFYISL